jgi:hypothetical protein
VFCRACGKEIVATAVICPHCGTPVSSKKIAPVPVEQGERLVRAERVPTEFTGVPAADTLLNDLPGPRDGGALCHPTLMGLPLDTH